MFRLLITLLAIPAALMAGKSVMNKLSGQPVVPSSLPPTPDARQEPPLGGEVSRELLDILVCPEDKGELELIEDGQYLLNPRKGYRYPIRDGIPIMLIEEGKKNKVPV